MGIARQTKTARGEVSLPLILRWNSWALAPVVLAAAAMVTPYFLTGGVPLLGLTLERGFAIVCHQRPERSFFLFGSTVAVCSRCLGIYLGAALGLVLQTSRTVALRLLMIAAAVNLLDAAAELAGWHGNWLDVRFALGLLLGAMGALLISSSSASSLISDNAQAISLVV